jgi:hypothetical protein
MYKIGIPSNNKTAPSVQPTKAKQAAQVQQQEQHLKGQPTTENYNTSK